MRKHHLHLKTLRYGIAAACIACCAALPTVAQASGKIVTFDAPGAGTALGAGTYPIAINGKSVITGRSTDDNHVSRGFIGTATGAISAFDAPDAGTDPYEGTYPTAINGSGVVTGYYVDTKSHGFVRLNDGTFEEFDAGSGQDTTPVSINNKGFVTGTAGLSAFLRKPNGDITLFSVAGATATGPHAINAAGTVAGTYYLSDNTTHGFFRTAGGVTTTFDVPGGFDNTYVDGINSAGDITGYAYNNVAYVGFVRKGSDGTFSIFYNIDGCQVNRVFPVGINFDGTVVGQCYDDSYNYRGFIRHADGSIASFSVPNSPGGTYAIAISANGKAIGYADDAAFVAHGFRLNAGKQ
jgi:hypothetical protein